MIILSKAALNLFVVLMIGSLVSCNNDISKEEVPLYRQLDSSLIVSNNAIQQSTRKIMQSLEAKMYEPHLVIVEKAKRWHTKADSVIRIAGESFKFLEDLKNKLRKQSGNNEKDLKAVRALFTDQQNSALNKQLLDCKKRLLMVDPEMAAALQAEIPLTKNQQLIGIEDIPMIAAHAKLSQLQSDLEVSTNMLVEFCHRKTGCLDCFTHSWFSLIVNTNGYRFYPGEEMEIAAGIYEYGRYANPNILFNGKKGVSSTSNESEYKFKVPRKPGTYKIPLEVQYIDPNTGQPAIVKKTIRYSVEPKCPR